MPHVTPPIETHRPAEELLSLSELARWTFMPVETLRRRVLDGHISADFKSGHGIFFRKDKVAALIATLKNISK